MFLELERVEEPEVMEDSRRTRLPKSSEEKRAHKNHTEIETEITGRTCIWTRSSLYML